MIHTIYEWASKAVSYIRFKPDRAPVVQELTNHWLDHRDDLMQGGMDRQAAERIALESMGDPDETGKLLNRMHKPYLGWLWVISRWVVSLTVFVFLIGIFRFPAGEAVRRYFYGWPTFYGAEGSLDIKLRAFYEGEDREREQFRVYGVCKQTARAGNYTISVERAVRWQKLYETDGTEHIYDGLRFILRAKADSPALGSPDALLNYLTARDSEGNEYENRRISIQTQARSLAGNPFGRNLENWYFDFWLDEYDPDAEWIDLCYDRNGISFVLRIDLTGDRV